MMKHLPHFSLNTALILWLFTSSAPAQESPGRQPGSVLDYRIVQYISVKGYHPIEIMRLDTNGELLLACKYGKTKEQLQAMNIPVNDSQICLLEIYHLLSRENGVLTTAFPVLGSREMGQIRKITGDAAPALADGLEKDVRKLVTLLGQAGWTNNAYSILFSYIVDSMVWSFFSDAQLIHLNIRTEEHPFWAGDVWAYLPERQFSCGTNTASVGPYRLKVNWSAGSAPVLQPFNAEKRKLDEAVFSSFVENRRTDSEAVKKAFMRFGIFDASGRLLIPVIEENDSNDIYQFSLGIAGNIADQIPMLLDLKGLQQTYRFRDTAQALIIVYHELMWDLMDEFVARGVVKKPVLFAHPESGTSADVADLVFVVQGG